MDDLEAAALKLRTFVDRVKGAAYGYAGFFDAVRINESELDKLYSYDTALLENVGKVAGAIDNVTASIGTDGLPAAIRNLVSLAQEAIDTYNRREEAMLAA